MMNMENQIPAAKSILLFGISNVGKTTVGQLLAAELGYKFYDLDEETKLYCHMTLEEFKAVSPVFEADIYDAISLKTCVEKRLTIGAPGKAAMEKVIAQYKEYLG